MHEASLIQGLLKIVFEALADYVEKQLPRRPLKVTEINCEAGLLAAFEPHTLQACFDLFTENTPAEGAQLIIQTAPLKCRCTRCDHGFMLLEKKFVCPACGSDEIHFGGGHGLTLQGVKIEEANDGRTHPGNTG